MSAGTTVPRRAAAREAAPSHRAARRRDRQVFLAAHPVLFAGLAFARRRPVRILRLPGRPGIVVISGTEEFRFALTRIPLDRLADGTTGAAVRAAGAAGALFDETGPAHRASRRAAGTSLSASAAAALAPAWTGPLQAAGAALAAGGDVDAVALARLIAGRVAFSLAHPGGCPSDERALALADAARRVAATTAAAHLPAPPWRRRALRGTAGAALALLRAELAGAAHPDLAAILVLAAVNTTVSALPRALAWAADAGLWSEATADAAALAAELLRVTAASPVLPRAAAADAVLPGGRRVRAGDRLVLVARHAARAHDVDPGGPVAHDADAGHACQRKTDAPSSQAAPVARLVFGAGPHACPGASLAHAMLADALRALAPHRPAVVAARADRAAALPSWASLELRAAAPGSGP